MIRKDRPEGESAPQRKARRRTHRIGLISDTHGLLRPEALAALEGSDAIIHAGDIGTPEILDALRAIAPVSAVRGNNDHGAWADALPLDVALEIAGARIVVIHDLATLALDPQGRVDVVVSGHSHQPKCGRQGNVLYVNPGSAGPRRFRLPVTVGRLDIAGGIVEPTIVPLEIGAAVVRR
jgi:putative phosphoesterase